MTKRTRRTHAPAFKAKVAVAAIKGEKTLAAFEKAGIDIDALAAKLQDDGAASFVASWQELMAGIDAKTEAARKAA